MKTALIAALVCRGTPRLRYVGEQLMKRHATVPMGTRHPESLRRRLAPEIEREFSAILLTSLEVD